MKVVVNLTQADSTALKASGTLASEVTNTFIFLANGTLLNTFGEPNIERSIAATEVTVDMAALELSSYKLDLDSGILFLSFNDVVRNNSFDPRGIVIQGQPYSMDGERYRLTSESYTLSPDGFQLDIQLGKNDLDFIKSLPTVATSREGTYLTLSASTIEDVFQNDILAITNGKAVQAMNYTDDVTPPTLLNYTLDIETGEVILTFSEAVNVSTLIVSEIVIQDSQNDSDVSQSLKLSGSSPFQSVSLSEIKVSITEDDLNQLKELTKLISNEMTLFLL